ncbi:hypothetical protein KGF56_003308 [Candida oxycetoniae]|uniref:Protein ILM1 n=1 Tax=Candida oxycetoniae TaxID=497107 RepID=A0AAI9WXB3_9ASCO|nr:uncharacterized protein KGF56_003308 [Candida oxycetoniae]KAI3403878.1 hypothetical protein KGF56_003308 [Candida oxycetoniae]
MAREPEELSTAGFVVLMGQAMQVPVLRLSSSNPLLSFVSIFFATTALSDLVPLLAENWKHFEILVPFRLFVYFALAAYIYFVPTSLLSNSLTITYLMFEIWCNFLIYNNLRDEKYYRMKKFVEENADAIKQAQGEQVRVIED